MADRPRVTRWLAAVGAPVVAVVGLAVRIVATFAEAVGWTLGGRWRGAPVRLGAVAHQIVDAGVAALPLTALFATAIGVVLAIQLSRVLEVADVLGVLLDGLATALARELAPILVGILVAARTGAGVAAALGAMQSGREIDGLRGMGLSPVRLLVAPVVAALVVCMPILTLTMTALVLGSFSLYLSADTGVPVIRTLVAVVTALTARDLAIAVIKSLCFAALIASIAATVGLGARSGAQAVGAAVTRATVLSITAVLIANAVITYASSG